MAKNRNQKPERRQQQPMERRGADVSGREQAKPASMASQQEAPSASADAPGTATKKRKKLGHN